MVRLFGRNGQASLEYLLVFAAVIGIVVTVVSVGTNFMSSKKTVAENKINVAGCSVEGISFPSGFNSYSGASGTAPSWIKPCGTCSPLYESSTATSPPSRSDCIRYGECSIGGYHVFSCLSKSKKTWGVYLQKSGGGYFVYGSTSGTGNGNSNGCVYTTKDVSGTSSVTVTICGSGRNNAYSVDRNHNVIITFDGVTGEYILCINGSGLASSLKASGDVGFEELGGNTYCTKSDVSLSESGSVILYLGEPKIGSFKVCNSEACLKSSKTKTPKNPPNVL